MLLRRKVSLPTLLFRDPRVEPDEALDLSFPRTFAKPVEMDKLTSIRQVLGSGGSHLQRFCLACSGLGQPAKLDPLEMTASSSCLGKALFGLVFPCHPRDQRHYSHDCLRKMLAQ